MKYKSGIETKRKIIEVSRKMFYEKGYEGTTIRDLAKENDIQPGAILYHFKSKEALYKHIYHEAIYKNFTETRKYVDQADQKEYLGFMLNYYVFSYKCYYDIKFRQFFSAPVNAMSMTIKEYFEMYFNYFKIITISFETFYKKHRLEFVSCYSVDKGLTEDIFANFEEYASDYSYKDLAEYNLRLYAKIFNLDSIKVENAFVEIEALLNKVDWKSLDSQI